MKITAEIRFINDTDNEKKENAARKVAGALSPDNTENIQTRADDDGVVIAVRAEKISSVLATADDLLMNADCAARILKKSADKTD